MPSNHRHYANVVPLTRIFIGLLVATSVVSAAIYYVWSRNEADQHGREIRELERQSERLAKEIEVVRGEIARRSSIATLQQNYSNGLIRLQPIGPYEPLDRLPSVEGDGVRAVGNPSRSLRQ